jgi:hypothetical protein
VRLSPGGDAARERWPSLDADVDASIGTDFATPLRGLVRRLYLEWPHYPTGYGPADHSITGGVYTAGGGQIDSKVPTHAADWAPVVRHDVDGSSVEGLPLSALLSQAFVAFAADFEELWIGGLHLAAAVLRLLPDDGVPVSDIPMLSRLKGDGKSVLERHDYIGIERDADNPKVRIALPTARGRNTRDEYEPTIGTCRGSLGAEVRHGCRRRAPVRVGAPRCRPFAAALGDRHADIEHWVRDTATAAPLGPRALRSIGNGAVAPTSTRWEPPCLRCLPSGGSNNSDWC